MQHQHPSVDRPLLNAPYIHIAFKCRSSVAQCPRHVIFVTFERPSRDRSTCNAAVLSRRGRATNRVRTPWYTRGCRVGRDEAREWVRNDAVRHRAGQSGRRAWDGNVLRPDSPALSFFAAPCMPARVPAMHESIEPVPEPATLPSRHPAPLGGKAIPPHAHALPLRRLR